MKAFNARAVPLIAFFALAGCSSQQLYNVGQAWQRNECFKVVDQAERSRCLSSSATSYDQYKKDSEAAAARR